MTLEPKQHQHNEPSSAKLAPLINIHQLPPELLLVVFDIIYFASMEDTTAEGYRGRRHHPLLDVMLVCQNWLSLVELSHKYWTVIEVGVVEQSDERQEQAALESALAKAGELPLNITLNIDGVHCLGSVVSLLKKRDCQWECLNILASGTTETRPAPLEHLETLLSGQLRSLSFLRVEKCLILDSPVSSIRMGIEINAPALQTLSCIYHLILPISPSSLKSLSVDRVDTWSLSALSFDSNTQIKLDQLVKLRLERCDPRGILPILDIPNLAQLIVGVVNRGIMVLPLTQTYHRLKELQWRDAGSTSQLSEILLLCPNLETFSNYVVGAEDLVPLEEIEAPPTVIEDLLELKRTIAHPIWPNLREMLLDCATCSEVTQLLELVPTIKRVRILHDPTTREAEEYQAREKERLKELRSRVEVAIWTAEWHRG